MPVALVCDHVMIAVAAIFDRCILHVHDIMNCRCRCPKDRFQTEAKVEANSIKVCHSSGQLGLLCTWQVFAAGCQVQA